MTLLGTAADCASGLQLLATAPNVMLVDLQLPDGNGIDLILEAAHRIASPVVTWQ